MKQLAVIYILVMQVCIAHAFSFDVDMPNSGDPKYDMVRITIDKCVTIVRIKKGDLDSFAKNDEIMKELVKQAIERNKNGCPKQ